MVYVTHDQVEALTLADRLVLLREGRIAQSGPPLELYHEPENLFVARFLGSPPMNLLPGRLRQRTDMGSLVELNDGTRLRVGANATGAVEGAAVTLGIRPEQVRLEDAANGLEARVIQVEHLGDHDLMYLERQGCEDLLVVRCPVGGGSSVGGALGIGLPPGDCLLFDRDGRAFPRIKP